MNDEQIQSDNSIPLNNSLPEEPPPVSPLDEASQNSNRLNRWSSLTKTNKIYIMTFALFILTIPLLVFALISPTRTRSRAASQVVSPTLIIIPTIKIIPTKPTNCDTTACRKIICALNSSCQCGKCVPITPIKK
jgi:hypothetical protein